MAEIKLFSLKDGVKELPSSSVLLEKELQNMIERNMETLFGVRFIKSEYAIKDGRMDSIGLDENNSPVIFEYKRSSSENVINQGLFYLDWLMEHKEAFQLLVQQKFGQSIADEIDWSVPCVICVANDFTRYDIHAVKQIQRKIKLVKYHKFGDDLIMFEHLNTPNEKPIAESNQNSAPAASKSYYQKTQVEVLQKLEETNSGVKTLYEAVCDYIESLGDDLEANQLKLYRAYKKVRNVFCLELQMSGINVWLKLDPDSVELEDGFTKDMRGIGHYGTGDLQVTIRSEEDFQKARALLDRAYAEA